MSRLGPEFGGTAGDVADALERLATEQPDAFDADEVTVAVDGEEYTVASEVANFSVEEVRETGEHVTPHVVEPSFGVDRLVYTLVVHGFKEDEIDGERRRYLDLDPSVAPTDAAVFPLVSDDELESIAEGLVADLRAAGLSASYDDSGNIGRRYRRQDEVGTPFCVTVDHEGTEGDGPTTVTVRERDTTAQVRVPVDEVTALLADLRAGDRVFESLRDEYDSVATDVTKA
jgi:glycyl-tRNA synthetase